MCIRSRLKDWSKEESVKKDLGRRVDGGRRQVGIREWGNGCVCESDACVKKRSVSFWQYLDQGCVMDQEKVKVEEAKRRTANEGYEG